MVNHHKNHHFWEKYVLHRFRRVANPSPSKKTWMSGEKPWGGRAMVCILTVHCTALGLGRYLGVNPNSRPQRLRKSRTKSKRKDTISIYVFTLDILKKTKILVRRCLVPTYKKILYVYPPGSHIPSQPAPT